MSNTIAAISTPAGAGGIGVIRISGDNAIEIADKITVTSSGKPLTSLKGYRAARCKAVSGGKTVDECVALVFRAPRSYTGEDTVEISCHGGIYVTNRILRAALEAGAKPAEAGEFTKRAFLNGKIDLSEAEAVMDLIGAQSENALQAALTALEGSLSKKIEGLCGILLEVSAHMGAWVDYPDEDIPQLDMSHLGDSLDKVHAELSLLIDRFDSGKAILGGVDTVIVGKPNVGKSALMNMLTGYNRSIVTDIAGTTRDIVEETVRLGSAVLRIADTAGIRESDDPVEAIGVGMAKGRIERASLILAVFDGSGELDGYDEEILSLCKNKNVIGIINKSDLPSLAQTKNIEASLKHTVYISAQQGEGTDALTAAVEEVLGTDKIDTTSAMLATERQRKNAIEALYAIEEARQALMCSMTMDAINVSVDSAIGSLLELTGKRANEAVVDEVFSRFCVGK